MAPTTLLGNSHKVSSEITFTLYETCCGSTPGRNNALETVG